MKKIDLVECIAADCNIPKVTAQKALNSVISNITKSLQRDEAVTLVGFGSFYVANRAARQGRNPQTNVAVHIPATRVPKFKAGKLLKDCVK